MKASYILATHYRPQLLDACLTRLRQSLVPEGVTLEIVVAANEGDPGIDVARRHGVQVVLEAKRTVGAKLTAAYRASKGEVILVTGDDDLQHPERLVCALDLHRQGAELVLTRLFRYVDLATGQVAQWVGASNAVGAARSFKRSILDQASGWPDVAKNVDLELRMRLERYGVYPRERELPPAIGAGTICLQHGTNIWPDRQFPEQGATVLRSPYWLTGLGHWSGVPEVVEVAGMVGLGEPSVARDLARMSFVVITCNRPRHLLNLLIDLEGEGARQVTVWDDSTAYADARLAMLAQTQRRADDFCRRRGWPVLRPASPYGKRNFWRLVSRAYASQRTIEADWFVFLPDDVRLAHHFAQRALAAWRELGVLQGYHPYPLALNLLNDSGRSGKACWTGIEPKPLSPRLLATGWVDGCFLCDRDYLEALEYQAIPVPSSWHKEGRGSGTYKYISQHLVDEGGVFGQVHESLVVHCNGSVMHPDIRAKEPLDTLHFADGEAQMLLLRDPTPPVHVHIATIPGRQTLLAQALVSLVPQADEVFVSLNGHETIPEDLAKSFPEVRWLLTDNERGDAQKFHWAWGEVNTRSGARYYFTCDDDIIYPPDYVAKMVDAVERYQRRAIVGVLGRVFDADLSSYYAGNHVRLKTQASLARDQVVHALGTGTTAFYSPTLPLGTKDFPVRNMADIWLAVAAKKWAVPMVAVARPEKWLKALDSTGIFEEYRASRFEEPQVRALQEHAPWPDLSGVRHLRDYVLGDGR